MKRCPLLNKDCIAERCAWWQDFMMRTEPGAEPHVERDCLVVRIPSMLIEVIKKINSAGAAIESRGNEIAKQLHAASARIGEVVEQVGIHAIETEKQLRLIEGEKA